MMDWKADEKMAAFEMNCQFLFYGVDGVMQLVSVCKLTE